MSSHHSVIPYTPLGGIGPAATGISRILVVCTGNVCRSPFGEIELRELLKGTGIHVTSAGIYALVGSGVDEGMIPELEKRGLSPEGFVAHQISAEDVDDADLILAMAARHRRFILDEWPHTRKKVVLVGAIPEMINAEHNRPVVAPGHGRRASRPLAFPSGVVTINEIHRAAMRSLPHIDDVPDPFRGPAHKYSESADIVSRHMRSLASALTVTIDSYLREKGQ